MSDDSLRQYVTDWFSLQAALLSVRTPAIQHQQQTQAYLASCLPLGSA